MHLINTTNEVSMTIRRELSPVARKRKTLRRREVVDAVSRVLITSQRRKWTVEELRAERAVQKRVWHELVSGAEKYFRDRYPSYRDTTIQTKATRAVQREGHSKPGVPSAELFGMRHRPDLLVRIDRVSVAVEVKLSSAATGLRDGIGQCLVYTNSDKYDFAILYFVDRSATHFVHRHAREAAEMRLLAHLWEYHNIRVIVVKPKLATGAGSSSQ